MAIKKGQLEDSVGNILHFETEAVLVTTDSSNRFVTDAQIADWNSKATGTHTHAQYMTQINLNGYWGLAPNGSDTVWVRTPTTGIIPYQSGAYGSGHGSLGTSSWYFATSYIDNMYGNLAGYFGGFSIDKFAKYYQTSGSVDISDTNKKEFYGTCSYNNASAPNTDWWHIMNIPHSDSNGYGGQLAIGYHGNATAFVRSASGTTWGSWKQLLTKDNVNVNIIASTSDPGGNVNDVWIDVSEFVFKVKQGDGSWRVMGAAYN